MPLSRIEPNFVSYHKSIASEIRITRNRIRNLIGSSHWQTDGEHKEAVLRKVLRTHLPESVLVGRGFACSERGNSKQIDIMLIDRDHPTLFKDGDLFIVTPDCIKAVVEVKTRIRSLSELERYLETFTSSIRFIRETNPHCWAGFFVHGSNRANFRDTLLRVGLSASDDPCRVINCLTFGESQFIRYWEDGSQVASSIQGRVWHGYEFPIAPFEPDLKGLAQAYFISNLVSAVSPSMSPEVAGLWFPIRDPNGKERYRDIYMQPGEHEVRNF